MSPPDPADAPQTIHSRIDEYVTIDRTNEAMHLVVAADD
jgi:hypothetical protein